MKWNRINSKQTEKVNLNLNFMMSNPFSYLRIEKARVTKLEMINAIQKFNFKPKHGIKKLLELGVIKENEYFKSII